MHDDVLPNNKLISPAQLAALHDGAWAWAMSIVAADKAVADDLLQQVYLLILEGRAHFDGKATLKTWLYGVIRNVGYRHHKGLTQHNLKTAIYAAEQRVNGVDFTDSTAQAEIEHVQQQDLLARAMNQLSPRQREVLELAVYREFTLEQCASILGIRVGSVRTHYHRGKAALRQALEVTGE